MKTGVVNLKKYVLLSQLILICLLGVGNAEEQLDDLHNSIEFSEELNNIIKWIMSYEKSPMEISVREGVGN